jgi:hypothetical protein
MDDNMKKEICFCVIVDKKYEKYIPYYSFFVLLAYPKSHIKILFFDKLSYSIRMLLLKINKRFGNKVQVVEQYKPFSYKTKAELKFLRWLIPFTFVKDFKYLFVGDVDILTIKEVPSLLEIRKKELLEYDIPYSNRVRPTGDRLSGLHFIEVEKYYRKVLPQIDKYLKKLKARTLRLHLNLTTKERSNEHVLYELIKDSGMKFPPIEDDPTRFHHGLHIGIYRTGRYMVLRERFLKMPHYVNWYKEFLEIEKDPLYKIINEKIPLKEIERMKKHFSTIGL